MRCFAVCAVFSGLFCSSSKTKALSVVSVQFGKAFLFSVFSHFGEQF